MGLTEADIRGSSGTGSERAETDIRGSSGSGSGSGRRISRNGRENLKLSHFRLLVTGVLTIQLWKGEQMSDRFETK